ncbi:prolyl-tRNA synthetase domain protein [Mycobacteroides abscessus 1948]|uniref:Prolyl-tRNA synthetase domain protein n=1 Tax=Mycobacteroides abscessus 1948 TaxID=1299323 RepID=A0A829QH16_9MYCO|nr:prolyl-tRNA synthetase domain protein [Mycobacteroides abscessus 1948]
MITRLSELFVRTLRDDPADAEVPSHKLLIRAGYVRPVAPGVYSWLPLGLRVLRKIENIVREEMNAIGGQEILLPALLPRARPTRPRTGGPSTGIRCSGSRTAATTT